MQDLPLPPGEEPLNFIHAQVSGQWLRLRPRVGMGSRYLQPLCHWSFSALRTLGVLAEAETRRGVGGKR